MAYSTIIKPNTQMNPVTYTGNGVNPTSITSVGFQPDFLWIKSRSDAFSHLLFDVVRGVDKRLISNSTAAESTEATISSFDTDGWTMDNDAANNGSSKTYVGWNWKAGGTAVSNTDGDIASQVSANTTAGFSIVNYTGNGTGSSTVGHGLGVAPAFVIIKNISSVDAWIVFPTGATRLVLNSNASDYGNNGITKGANTITLPSGVDNAWNTNGQNYVMYTFAEKKGFSKFGSYVGNGNADGTFIYTGFKPAYFVIKRTDATENWYCTDIKRNPINPVDNELLLLNSDTATITTSYPVDFLSNGFKIRGNNNITNASGATYIYMAFAENPLVANTSGGIPTTAR